MEEWPNGNFQWLVTPLGRFSLWGLTAAVVIAAEQLIETLIWPNRATQMALDQMTAESSTAQSLTFWTTAHSWLPAMSLLLIAMAALFLLLPGHTRRLRRLLEALGWAS